VGDAAQQVIVGTRAVDAGGAFGAVALRDVDSAGLIDSAGAIDAGQMSRTNTSEIRAGAELPGVVAGTINTGLGGIGTQTHDVGGTAEESFIETLAAEAAKAILAYAVMVGGAT
jgi:hypothetical protein